MRGAQIECELRMIDRESSEAMTKVVASRRRRRGVDHREVENQKNVFFSHSLPSPSTQNSNPPCLWDHKTVSKTFEGPILTDLSRF